ncbi:hypothetical protein V6N13_110236 [Hibiscus sabdariffa]|uniref:Uncharacterized protein n=1 Tax=Hibiscus sabdariffa TaxID=183260 RepID=A0ABR2AES8_9ROSI
MEQRSSRPNLGTLFKQSEPCLFSFNNNVDFGIEDDLPNRRSSASMTSPRHSNSTTTSAEASPNFMIMSPWNPSTPTTMPSIPWWLDSIAWCSRDRQILLKQEKAVPVTALAVNQESGVLYCGSSDGLVNFWEREKHLSHGRILRGHKMAVLCLATSGNLVFSGSADGSVCVWRREEGGAHKCLQVLTGHTGPVKCLAVEEDDRTSTKIHSKWIVYSGSLGKSVKVWRVSEDNGLVTNVLFPFKVKKKS